MNDFERDVVALSLIGTTVLLGLIIFDMILNNKPF
jgi:hypothetical protein